MRKFLRSCFINAVSLSLLVEIFPGFQIDERLKGVFLAGLGLTIINSLVRPILKAIFLPINLLTLGTLRWVINVVNLYLLILLVPQISISAFAFQGANYQGIIIPSSQISSLLSLVFASLLLTLIKKIVIKIIKKPSSDA